MKLSKTYPFDVIKNVSFGEPVGINRLIGLKIMYKRLKLQISQKELAERCGCKPSQISRIERGENSIRLVSFETICYALDCKSSDLLPF